MESLLRWLFYSSWMWHKNGNAPDGTGFTLSVKLVFLYFNSETEYEDLIIRLITYPINF